LHTFAHIAKFGYKEGDFPAAELAAAEVLSLPVHPRVSEADIRTIIDAVKEISDAN
jgi:dTDP-4-amino-4,6-dideoxygalactose transaminase